MKYIIDIPDKAIDFMGGRDHVSVFVEPECKVGDCKHYALRISKEDIEPYTEPNRKAIENEVWDFATSCIDMDGIDFYRCFENDSVYYLTEYTYSEAKSKYDEWKRKEEEIRVGDEIDIDGEITVVTMVNKHGEILSVDCGGMTYYYHVESQLKRAKKTGRHFYEVEDLLKKIKEK